MSVRGTALALLLAALLLHAPAAAHAAPAWLAPQDLSVAGTHGGHKVAFGPQGNAVAIWSRKSGSNQIVQAATRPAGGSWSQPQNLSAADRDAFGLDLALDPQGNAVATWASKQGVNDVSAEAATRPAGGGSARDGWSARQVLSAAGQNAYNSPRVAVDPQGRAVAIWLRSEGGKVIVQAATRPAGGAWSSPQSLSAPGEPGEDPQVALDGQGNAVALWTRAETPNVLIPEAATRPADGGATKDGWSEPRRLSAADRIGFAVQLAVNPQGDAVALWRSVNPPSNRTIVQATTRPAGGSWSGSRDLSAEGLSAFEPQVALDAQGNAVAIWRRSNGSALLVQASTRPTGGGPTNDGWGEPRDLGEANDNTPLLAVSSGGDATVIWDHIPIIGTSRVIQASSRPGTASPSDPRGGWSEPRDLTPALGNAGSPQVALDPKGNTVAIWRRSDGPNAVVEAATRRPDGGWSEPTIVSGAPFGSLPESITSPQLALDSQGNAVVTWSHFDTIDGASTAVVAAAGYDAAGPQLRDLVVPAAGNAGSPLSFSVAPLDVWSPPIASTSWSFGDGITAAGPGVTHTYPAAGTYNATVTSTDSLGNATTQPRALQIAAAPGGGDSGPGAGESPAAASTPSPATAPPPGPAAASTPSPPPTAPPPPVRATPSRPGLPAADPEAAEARRALALRRCLSPTRRLKSARRRAAQRRCRSRHGRTPGRVTGLTARAVSSTKLVLSFLAPGSDRTRAPAARRYTVKQSLRPIGDAKAFRRAQTLCAGTCRLGRARVGQRLSLTITDLRPNTTYHYAIAARDNVSGRLGPRSLTIKITTRRR